jgi:hypothetical protein
MKQGEKLLLDLQQHIVEAVDICGEMIDQGVASEGEWKFDFITVVYGRRVDSEAKENDNIKDSFQRMMYTDDNYSNLVGVLELSKAEVIHNILNGDES